ncbi:AAA family ATPase [Pontiella agarivorans]|uniref:AAA family ATPase n=1 Tax=Pontiella agarivorans TaxID=3038953 RepID=A0ABU5MUZ7_9BACT|nr:AAA family ATPase [Pontiella agarivorans]MDZ8118043.1 AAA family ATPase [Pontiella agarivorans]
MHDDIVKMNERYQAESEVLQKVRDEVGKVIIGQEDLIEALLLALLCNGHVLIEGIPGLAKTLAVTTLSQTLHAGFNRIQFTPDLLPGDLLGTMMYNPKTSEFTPHKGPIFANIILADEINRSPAKVQSALLEAMQEHQVSIGDETYKLDEPFLVLATQNPVEQEGTYHLPEAQVDRFMFKLDVVYPTKDEEHRILKRMGKTDVKIDIQAVMQIEDINRLRKLVDDVFMDEKLEHYILDLVQATRDPEKFGLDCADMIRYGASPRATIFLSVAARGKAMLNGRGYVVPQDVKDVAMDVLRHRVLLTYEAAAEEKSSEDILKQILDTVEVP